jgi:hypothetical protein
MKQMIDHLTLPDQLQTTAKSLNDLLFSLKLNQENIRTKPNSKEFSILENICHLRDIEIEGHAIRMKRILNEQTPLLPDINGDQLAIDREYNKQDLKSALSEFTVAREQNLTTLSELNPSNLKRKGIREGIGVVTLEELLSAAAQHDCEHLMAVKTLLQNL